MSRRLIPLFPLQLVVFPRTRLPLHIFEERYKEMVGNAIRDNSEFGIVLAKATYGNYLVLYQGATVGRHKQDIPQLGERVILYPGSAVVGRAVVEDGAVLSQGARAINRRVPENQMAFADAGGDVVFRPTPDGLIREYFRL